MIGSEPAVSALPRWLSRENWPCTQTGAGTPCGGTSTHSPPLPRQAASLLGRLLPPWQASAVQMHSFLALTLKDSLTRKSQRETLEVRIASVFQGVGCQ